MVVRELQARSGSKVRQRQNTAPCPGGNGTTVGTFQEFTVLCNISLGGDVLDTLEAFDFTTCADLCSSSHPKCDGASFDGSRCTLRARFRPEEQRPSRRTNSAIGTFPGANSNCPTLGGSQQALGISFATMCGFIISGNDISQNFAPTFQDCLGQCASTTGCAALSFDPSQELGFKNCYLKTMVTNSSAVAADRRTDSAMVAGAVSAPSSPVAAPAPGAPAGAPAAGPGVSTVPLPAPPSGVTPGAGSGVMFFTPPGGNAAATPAVPTESAPAPGPPFTSSATTTSGFIAAPSSSPVQNSVPFTFSIPSTPPAAPSTEAVPEAVGQEGSSGPPSMAWVAAPVVGSVAAIALIAVSFMMLRRRRRASVSTKFGSARSSPWSSLLSSWLPASWTVAPMSTGQGSSRNGGGISSRSSSSSSSSSSRRKMAGMGNVSEVESGRRGADVRASVRSSVAGYVSGRPMGRDRLEDIEEGEASGKGGTRVYEVRHGRAELRNSLNGLGQNKWSS